MEISEKDVYKAVSNYLSNELGIDRNYVNAMLKEKIEARNPEELVRAEVSKYFRKGPYGWQADKFVLDKTHQVINEIVNRALENGVREQLESTIQEHVAQITGKPVTNTGLQAQIPNIQHTEAVCIMNTNQLQSKIAEHMHPWFNKTPAIGIYVVDDTWQIIVTNTGMSVKNTKSIICDKTMARKDTCFKDTDDFIIIKQPMASAIAKNAAKIPFQVKTTSAIPHGIMFIGQEVKSESRSAT